MITLDKLTRIELEEAAEFLLRQFPFIGTADLVIQLGSGQRPDNLFDETWERRSLHEMPGMPAEDSIAAHNLEIIWGLVGDVKVLVYAGRFHWYEGYGRLPCILPIWAAANVGLRNFLLCNAAGGIAEQMQPGTFMLVTDHINCLGVSPIAGHQHLLKSPYVDMSDVYDLAFRQSLLQIARESSVPMEAGVYLANCGPQYETPAEVGFARAIGADAVGMSTVLEATVARACGGRVAAISMISNRACGLCPGKFTHEDILLSGKTMGPTLVDLLRKWLRGPAIGLL